MLQLLVLKAIYNIRLITQLSLTRLKSSALNLSGTNQGDSYFPGLCALGP